MLRKSEQRSPTEICHVYDINVRCYVKAAGAQCALLCSQQKFLIHEKFRERFRAAAIRLCLERLYCAASLPNLAGFFCAVCRLTNVQQTHMLLLVRNACATWEKGGC